MRLRRIVRARWLAAGLVVLTLSASCGDDDDGVASEEDASAQDSSGDESAGGSEDDASEESQGTGSAGSEDTDDEGLLGGEEAGASQAQDGVPRSGSLDPVVVEFGGPVDGVELVDVVSIDANADGTVMALTEEALFRLDVDPPVAVALPAGGVAEADDVAAGPEGTAWLLDRFGGRALRYDGQQWLEFPAREDPAPDGIVDPPLPLVGDVDENGTLWSTAATKYGVWVWGSTGLVRFDPDFSWSLIARPDRITECEWCWYDLAPDGAVWTLTETGVSRYNPSGSWTDYPFDEATRRVLFDPQSGPAPWSGSLDWSSGGELTTWVMDAEQRASSPQWLRLDSSRSGSTTVEGWPMDAATAAIDRECLEVEYASELAGELVDLDEILASEEETLRFVGNVARGLEAAPDGTAYAAFTCVGVTHLLGDGTADLTPASELPSPHISDLTVGPDGTVWVSGDDGVTTLG